MVFEELDESRYVAWVRAKATRLRPAPRIVGFDVAIRVSPPWAEGAREKLSLVTASSSGVLHVVDDIDRCVASRAVRETCSKAHAATPVPCAQGKIYALLFSDHRHLWCGTHDGLQLWEWNDETTGEAPVQALCPTLSVPGALATNALCQSEDHVFSAQGNGHAYQWDKETRTTLGCLRGRPQSYLMSCCTVAPSGNVIAAGSEDGYLLVWDVRSGSFPIHTACMKKATNSSHLSSSAAVPSLVCDWDGSFLACGTMSKQLKSFQVGDWRLQGEANLTGAPNVLRWSKDGFLSGCEGDSSIRMWDLQCREVGTVTTTQESVYGLAANEQAGCEFA